MESTFAIWKHFRFLKQGQVNLESTDSYFGRHGTAYHYQRGRTKEWHPFERGGYTLCFIYDGGGKLVAVGRAECSKLDPFSYRLGREISLGRALKVLRG